MSDRSPPSTATFWVLPAVFALHDGEELVTTLPWIAAHHARLEQLARQGALGRRLVESLPASQAQETVAVAAVAALVLAVTIGAAATRRPGLWLSLYSTVLGLLFLHVFTHVGQAVLFRGYVPGLAGAVGAVLPGSLFVYRRLFAARLLGRRQAILTALVGIALLVPGALAALALARWVTG